MATPAFVIKTRYQVKGKPIGQGGMGMVYRAYDTVTKRDVALKTLRGGVSVAELELFAKEWSVLAHVSHPNIIDILDTGEFEQDGEKKPFFVMPLLPGNTLGHLIANSSTRLTVDRVVGIVAQTCRGLQAAHEQGLIHRDLKPSNIFVMDDDTVKIIDFGVVHLAGTDSIKSLKGTLQYMSPEQIEMKPPSAASDIFSLGVVCYQALTGRKPFARNTEEETSEAVRRYIPPPVFEVNTLVSQVVSRVIHKAMAKDPWHRFSTAREFGETLQKALHGQPIERFEREKIQPRIERAKKAQAEGDHTFASEILSELEAEGNIDPEMRMLRIQLDQAIRQKSIRQLLDSARTRQEEEEFPLALQKLQEVLAIDPDNADALSLRHQIERLMSDRQTENWFRLSSQHLHNNAFDQAKQALQEILKLNAKDSRAHEMLLEVDRREQEVNRLRAEKERLYQAAVNCYQEGEVSSALTKLERVMEMHRQSPDSAIPDRDAQYQSLYNQIRTERDAARSSYAEGRRYLADRNFTKALELCAEYLKKSPGDPMFQALKLEAEEQQRQEQSSFIADVARRVEAEADLDRRVNILKEAVERYPDEQQFQQSLRLVRERRDLVNGIVGRARQYEERSQYNEALSQLDILRNIYSQYPGLQFEAERLKLRRDEQVREESKARWVDQIDRQIAAGDYVRATELLRTAISEFPDDKELAGLDRLARQALQRSAEAAEWLQRGQQLCFDRQFGEGLEALQRAAGLDNRNAVIRAALLNALLEQARSVLGQDWRAAEPLIEQALNIDGGHPLAKSLQGLVLDYKRQEILNDCVLHVRELQANGDLNAALAKLEEVLVKYPNEVRLVQLRQTLQTMAGTPVTRPVVPPPAPPAEDSAATSVGPVKAPPAADPQSTAAADAFTVDRSVIEIPAKPKAAPAAPAPPPLAKPTVAKPAHPPQPARPGVGVRAQQSLQRLPALLKSWAQPGTGLSKLQWAFICAIPVLLVAALIAGLSHKKQPKLTGPVEPPDYAVDLEANHLNAKYRVDGNAVGSPLRLPKGRHTAEASLLGYKTDVKQLDLSPSSPKPVSLSFQLVPEPVRLQVISDLKAAKVSVDGKEAADLQEGGFLDETFSVSENHTFSLIQGGKDALTFSFHAEPAQAPTVSEVKAKDVNALVVSSIGTHVRLYSSDPSKRAGLKDQPTQAIPADGMDFPDTGAAPAIVVDSGKAQMPLSLDIGNAPTVRIQLNNDPDAGTIEVDLAAVDVQVSIDSRRPRPLHTGKNSLSGIPAGRHKLHFVKDGFDPVDREVELNRSQILPLTGIEFTPTVRTASLEIENATPGAQITIGDSPRGAIGDNGTAHLSDVSPGDHIIHLRRQDFEPRDIPRTFIVGQAGHIGGAEGQLTPFGSLAFQVKPSNASITYRLGLTGEPTPGENNKTRPVKQGHYMISLTEVDSVSQTLEFDVKPGAVTPVDITLKPRVVETAKPTPTPVVTLTKDLFRDARNWTQDGDWWVHKGGDSWFTSNQGVFYVEFRLQKAKTLLVRNTIRPAEWIVDQSDGNQIRYVLDFKGGKLERQVTTNGKSAKTESHPVAVAGDTFGIRIDISAVRVVVSDGSGKIIDTYDRLNPAVALGNFGFRGEVELKAKKD